jgi:hypothetical protein
MTLGSAFRRLFWKKFWLAVVRRFAVTGTVAVVLSAADGPLPIGELISIGLALWTVYEIVQLWDVLTAEAEREALQEAAEQPEPETPIEEEQEQKTPSPVPETSEEEEKRRCCCRVDALRPMFVGRIGPVGEPQDTGMGHLFHVEIDIANVPAPDGVGGGECSYEWIEGGRSTMQPWNTDLNPSFATWQQRPRASQVCPWAGTMRDIDAPQIPMGDKATRLFFIDAVAHSAPGCGQSHRVSMKQYLSVSRPQGQGRPDWLDPGGGGVQRSFLDIDGNRADPEPYGGIYAPNPIRVP